MFTQATVVKMKQLYEEKEQSIEHGIKFCNNDFIKQYVLLLKEIATSQNTVV
jgi:hypothetical protein